MKKMIVQQMAFMDFLKKRLAALLLLAACSTVQSRQGTDETSPPHTPESEKEYSSPEKQVRKTFPLLRLEGAIKRSRLVLILPPRSCLSVPYDSLLFHGVSGSRFRLKKTPACEQQPVSALFARDLSGYQNYLPAGGGWLHPAEALPRWTEEENWLILGFAPLDDATILVEAENADGDYRAFHVRELQLREP